MFKRVLFLLIIPCLVFAANVAKKYSFGIPVIRNGVVYVEGCQTSRIDFEPCLPTKPVCLVLPLGEEAVGFEVEYADPIELSGVYYVTPFRPGGIKSNPPPAQYYTRASTVYSTDAYYPAQIQSPSYYTQYRYGHSIFTASIRPVQYNPVSGKLRYFNSITVKLTTEKKRTDLPVYKFNSFIKSQLQLEVDNPEALENLSYSSRDGENYEYLIITTEALKGSWTNFVDFNKRRCLRTKIQTIEYINANGTGADSPEKLKNYIKNEYTTHGIVFVMLGGDDNFNANNTPMATAITHRSYSASFKDYGVDPCSDKDIAADMFYETMDGQELQDLEWELYAGRFPADNATELGNIIDKTIKYSEQPVAAAVNKVLLAGEYAWANINGGSCYGKDEMYLLKDVCTKNGYTTTGYDSKVWTYLDLQEPDISWSKNQLANYVNQNVNFINHSGHSNNFTIMNLTLGSSGALGDVALLTNTGFFIGNTNGCYCGSWDNRKIANQATINTGHYDATTGDCIAEALTVGTKNAAVVYISNTRYGLGDDGHASTDGTDGSSIRVMRYFVDAVFGQKMHHAGIMHAYSKWINKAQILVTDVNTKPYYGQMAYVAYEFNMLGDPALSVWTKTPATLTPSTQFTQSADKFEWNLGLPYTWVAICKPDGEIISTDFTGVDGKCLINDAAYKAYYAASGFNVKVRVKAHNYLPYEYNATGIIQNEANSLYQFNAYYNATGKAFAMRYRLNKESLVNVSLYNAKGIHVKTLLQEHQKAGDKAVNVQIGNLSNGVYYYKVKINNNQFVDKLLINK